MPFETVNILPERVTIGPESAEKTFREFEDAQVLLITDRGLMATGIVEKLTRVLKHCDVFSDLGAEPTTDDLDRALAVARKKTYDVVAGLGGGSALDIAKATAALEGSVFSAREALGNPDVHSPKNRTRKEPPCLIAVPTTAGTGSESTLNAIFIDIADGVKKAVISRLCLPKIAVLDPSLTFSLPARLTASTGTDALCHCVESLISVKAGPISATYSDRGIRLIERNLATAVASPSDLRARENMLVASFWGGAALALAGTNAVHALAYPLGKRGVPHGMANSMLFMPVMRFNLDACEEALISLAVREHTAEEVLNRLGALLDTLPLPGKADEFNIPNSELDALAAEAMEQTRLLANNPKPLSLADAKAIYSELF